MPPSRPPADPLQKLLDEAESDLSRRLHEACEAEAQGVSSESTAEIRRLEDTLLAAAMAAERTIVARRHLQDTVSGEEPAPPEPKPTARRETTGAPEGTRANTRADTRSDSPADSTVVREFEDENGRKWRGWPVMPDVRRAHQTSLNNLGEYREGWICFEALDDSGRRRLPRSGRRWSDLPAEELPRLLAEAITVPVRKRH
jgi:hypothetical protein